MKTVKITDVRGKLPRHETKKFGRRKASDIRGVVFHQAAGVREVEDAARYHVGPNHLSPDGAPGLCYTFFVEPDGKIYQGNDLEDITWSQGGNVVPLPGTRGNTNFLAVCFGGDFSGPGHTGKDEPTKAQLESARALWAHLRDTLKLAPDALYGHSDFGKPACPGEVLGALITELRTEGLGGAVLPDTVKAWQAALVALGFDLGTWGPGKDGVDGDWGSASRRALVAFQTERGLPLTGYRDTATALEIVKAIKERSAEPSKPPSE